MVVALSVKQFKQKQGTGIIRCSECAFILIREVYNMILGDVAYNPLEDSFGEYAFVIGAVIVIIAVIIVAVILKKRKK